MKTKILCGAALAVLISSTPAFAEAARPVLLAAGKKDKKAEEAAKKAEEEAAAAAKKAEEEAAAKKAEEEAAAKKAEEEAAAAKKAEEEAAARKAEEDAARKAQEGGASKDAAAAPVASLEDDGEPTPDNCAKEWFCFKPPADETTHPDLTDSKFKTYLATALLGPIGPLLVLRDAEKPVLLDDDLKALIKSYLFPSLIVFGMYLGVLPCILVYPVYLLGLLTVSVVAQVMFLWVIPMTQISLINRATMRNKQAAAPKKE